MKWTINHAGLTIRCVVIEDESLSREMICDSISMVDELVLGASFSHPLEAHKYLQETETDLIFLDIEMPLMNGLQLMRSLKKPPLVIFVSSHQQYAVETYDLDTVDFLLKPFTFDRFLKAINRAKERLTQSHAPSQEEKSPDHFFIRTESQFVKIRYHDIIYIEAMKDFVKIITKPKTHIALINLKNIEEQLPKEFLRVHRSYIINTIYIESIGQGEIHTGEHTIPMAQTYKDKVFEAVVGQNVVKR